MSLRSVRDQGVQESDSASGMKPRVWLGGSPPKRLWTLRPDGLTIAAWCDGIHTGSAGRVRSVSRYASRLFDVVIASLLLIVLAPVMAVIAVLVRTTSPGPALFRQTRIGYLEAPFVMYKFRTMYDKSDDQFHREYVSRMLTHGHEFQKESNGLFKLEQDPRITRFGRFLRRSSLDELPQLFNVVRGEMSLVGPRPALPWEVELYKRHHRLRFQVKPGITGLWQVSGRSKLSMNTALDLDVEYVRSWGLALDLWILIMTLPALFRGGAR